MAMVYAEQRSSVTQFELGQMFSESRGPRDYQQAAHWFDHAARQGNPNAQYKIGLMYSRGIGVSQNYIKSYAWLKVAASQGSSRALRYLKRIAAKMPSNRISEAKRLSQRYYQKYVAPF
jgi:TPR repeat protein